MARAGVSIRKYVASRPSRRDISTSAPKRASTSPQRWNMAAPAVTLALKPFSEIPGPVTLPILKHTHHVLPRIGSFHHTVGLGLLEGLRDKYGDLVRLGKAFKGRPLLYVFDPEIMREVYDSGETEPPVWERSPLQQHRDRAGEGCPAHRQESKAIWGALRALLQDGGMLKNYQKAFEEIAADFTQRLEKLRHKENALNDELETEVYRWATESIGVLVFGIRLGCLDGPTHEPSAENRRPEKTSMDDDIPDVCSLLKRPMEDMTPAEQLVRCCREIADSNYLVRSEGTLKTESQSFNEALKALDRHFRLTESFLEKALQALSEDQRPEQALLGQLRPLGARLLPLAADALLSGVEPVVSVAMSMLHRVSLQAAVQQRVHDEAAWRHASEAAGAGAQPPVLAAACAREALRLHPATGGVVRRTRTPTHLAGYEVPAGVDVVLAHGVTCTSDRQWGRGKAFVPERWCAEAWRPLQASHAHPVASLPFGERCPAAGPVPAMLAALAASLLHTYRLEWHGPKPLITTNGVNRLQPPYYFVLQNAA